MRRALLLANVFLKALATPPNEILARFKTAEERTKLAAECQQLFDQQIEKMRPAGLWDLLKDREREFMQTGIFETTMQHRIDASWLAESIMCLHWALGLRDQIPPYDQEVDPKSNQLPQGWKARELVGSATLRPQAEIGEQREPAELCHWRCRTHMLLTTKKIPIRCRMERPCQKSSAWRRRKRQKKAPSRNRSITTFRRTEKPIGK
jgi:hypothetical protein